MKGDGGFRRGLGGRCYDHRTYKRSKGLFFANNYPKYVISYNFFCNFVPVNYY